MRCVWQILVPCEDNDKKGFRERYHRVWDAYVKKVSGGLTIHQPAKGKWVGPDGTVFEDRMIPVTFIATREEAQKICEHTLTYYKQEAVLCYKLADDFILLHKK